MSGRPNRVDDRVQRPAAPLLGHQLIRVHGFAQPHRHRDVGQRGPQAERVRAGGGLALVPDAAAQQVVDEAALRAQFQRRAVLFDHPVQRQGLCRAFEGGDGAVVGVGILAATARRDQPTPLLPIRTDGLRHPGALSRNRIQSGPPLPVGQQLSRRHAASPRKRAPGG